MVASKMKYAFVESQCLSSQHVHLLQHLSSVTYASITVTFPIAAALLLPYYCFTESCPPTAAELLAYD